MEDTEQVKLHLKHIKKMDRTIEEKINLGVKYSNRAVKYSIKLRICKDCKLFLTPIHAKYLAMQTA